MIASRRGRLAAAAIAAAASCHLPAWRGEVPPLVPIADPCGSGALTREGAAAIHRRPYLQSGEREGVTVVWAGLPGGAPRVAVAVAADAARAPIAQVAGRHSGPTGERSLLAARLTGLPPGERYCYRVESDRGPLTEWATLALAPPPDPDRVDRFVVVGDSGNGSRAQRAIARRLAQAPMDAILFLGDIAYNSGTAEQLQTRFFDVYSDLFQRVPVYSAIGNHDARTRRGRPFEEAFVLPGNERWYSFELGDVHFVVLDTTRLSPEQAAWLDGDLATAERRFTVVLGHHPPFSAARRGPSVKFRRWFVPILERHRVELVLTGHEHHYERIGPIHGIHYVVSGGGGARLTAVGRGPNTKVARAVHHFLTLEVHPSAIRLRAIDIDGRIIDEHTVPARRP